MRVRWKPRIRDEGDPSGKRKEAASGTEKLGLERGREWVRGINREQRLLGFLSSEAGAQLFAAARLPAVANFPYPAVGDLDLPAYLTLRPPALCVSLVSSICHGGEGQWRASSASTARGRAAPQGVAEGDLVPPLIPPPDAPPSAPVTARKDGIFPPSIPPSGPSSHLVPALRTCLNN